MLFYTRPDGTVANGGTFFPLIIIFSGFFIACFIAFGYLAAFGVWGCGAALAIIVMRRELAASLKEMLEPYRWLLKYWG